MNIQVTASHSDLNVSKVFKSHSRSSVLCVAPPEFCILRTKTLKLTINGAPIYQRRILPDSYLRSRYQRCPPVCFFGGKGRPENGDEASPRKSIEKGFGNLKKEQSVEDALRQQIEKQEYYDDGGSDGNRSGGGGGRGDGGRGDGGRGSSGGGSGGSGDESFHEFLDEQLQVILAAAGLRFVYEYLINGENWPYLARDYIKALFGMRKSYRVRQNMEWWANYYQELVKYWSDLLRKPPFVLSFKRLAREIAETETWWDVPFLYKSFMPEFYTQFLSPQKVKTRRLKSIKDEDDGAESEDEVELKRRISGDECSDFEKEFGDVSGSDKEVEMENSKEEEEEEDSDPFESYLIDDYEDEGKEEEEKDFLSYVDKIDMAKAATLASDSEEEEEEEEEEEDDDVAAGYPEDYLSFLFGPNDYVEGPVRLAPKKKKTQKKKNKNDNGKKVAKG